MNTIIRENYNAVSGFTLTEILVGIVIIAIISLAMAGALTLNTSLQLDSHDRAIATTLAQHYLEDIRNSADLSGGFDALETTFPDTAGFAAVDDYPGFLFRQRVDIVSNDLKRAESTISWARTPLRTGQMRIVSLIARPGPSLNGNIEGFVRNTDTGAPITGATVALTWNGPGAGPNIGTTTTDGAGFYTFQTLGPAPFQVPTGPWFVNARHANYFGSDQTGATVSCNVSSGVSTQADINLTPLPNPGTISGTVTDSATGTAIQGINVMLYQNRLQRASVNTGPDGSYSFENLSPGTYTVATIDTYKSGYSYFFGQDDVAHPNRPYPPHGWSSAQTSWPTNIPRQGNSSSDNIVVISDSITPIDIILDPIPREDVTGIVYGEDDADPRSYSELGGARVRIRWYNNGAITTVNTDAFGRYTANIPIPYFVFPDQWNRWHKMDASCSGYNTAYPDTGLSTINSNRISGTYVKLFHGAGPNEDVNFLLPIRIIEYGDVEGYVRDSATVDSLSAVRVTIGGKSSNTDGSGYYFIENIPVGWQTVSGRKSGYYNYSRSNAVTVIKDETVRYDFEMESIGYGSVTGTVTSLAAGNPVIEGARVKIQYYRNAQVSAPADTYTGFNGVYTFSRVLETTRGKHTLIVSAPGYITRSKSNVDVTAGGIKTEGFQLAVDTKGF